MRRAIIEIDEALCDGCGDCIGHCHEGAIALVDGKARLVSDIYCDGLGACLGHCPRGAIRSVQREAAAFDEAAVARHLAQQREQAKAPVLRAIQAEPLPCGCPGSAMRSLKPAASAPASAASPAGQASALGHWPVQLRLVPPEAPFLRGADILVCADCVPFAVPDFHARYLAGRAVLVGCPKLDDAAEQEARIAAILRLSSPRSLTVLRMEVPCCGRLAQAAMQAFAAHGGSCSLRVVTIAIDGTER